MKELYLIDLEIKYVFSIGLRRDACEDSCFKVRLVQDTTNLYTMIPV